MVSNWGGKRGGRKKGKINIGYTRIKGLRSNATYAVSDNDGVCSGCLLSEQISE